MECPNCEREMKMIKDGLYQCEIDGRLVKDDFQPTSI